MTANEERTLRRAMENVVEELCAIRGYMARLTIAVETIGLDCAQAASLPFASNVLPPELINETTPAVVPKSTR